MPPFPGGLDARRQQHRLLHRRDIGRERRPYILRSGYRRFRRLYVHTFAAVSRRIGP